MGPGDIERPPNRVHGIWQGFAKNNNPLEGRPLNSHANNLPIGTHFAPFITLVIVTVTAFIFRNG